MSFRTVRRAIAVVLLLQLAFIGAIAAQSKPAPPKEDPIVYATKTGEKYHSASCRHLAKSKIPMKLSEAVKKYTACSVCKPPKPQAGFHRTDDGALTALFPISTQRPQVLA